VDLKGLGYEIDFKKFDKKIQLRIYIRAQQVFFTFFRGFSELYYNNKFLAFNTNRFIHLQYFFKHN
jgi:hypothetical protein